MDIKKELLKVLVLPLIVVVFAWWHETYKTKNQGSFKEIIYKIERGGDEELIDEESLAEAITKIKKENTSIEKVQEIILLIKGVKKCILSLDVEKNLTIKVTPKKIFAQYKAKNAKDNIYIDEDFEFIETKKRPLRKNILIIENTDLLEGDELKKHLKDISKLCKDNELIYKYEIKDKKIFSYNIINNERKEYSFKEEEEKGKENF